MTIRADVAIIGAGAAGLMAAAAAAQTDAGRVVLLERNSLAGVKLALTGNGRGNWSHQAIAPAAYHTENTAALEAIWNSCSQEKLTDQFAQWGIFPAADREGRIYPQGGEADYVRDALLQAAERNGVQVVTGFAVEQIEQTEGGFRLVAQDGRQQEAARLVLTTGGKAAPKTGSQGSAYGWLRRWGCQVTMTHPALVQLTTEENCLRTLRCRADGAVTLLCDGRKAAAAKGEVQFTPGVLSGICVMDLSRHVARTEQHTYQIVLDLAPLWSEEDLQAQARQLLQRGTAEDAFRAFVPKRLAAVLAEAYDDPGKTARGANQTGADGRFAAFAGLLKHWTLSVSGTKGWSDAQVTAGGLALGEVNPQTMELLRMPGIYAAGELLDADGPCGGYNLQWAWLTGFLAGKGAAK